MKRRLKSTCHHVRATIKEVYTGLQALGLRIAQDKTYGGRVSKGFDFLGFHCRPTAMTVSEASLSRRDQKIARLYEQGASKERVGAYLRRWAVWAGVRGVALMTLGLTVGGCVATGGADEEYLRRTEAARMKNCVERQEKLMRLEEQMTGEKGCRPKLLNGCKRAKVSLLGADYSKALLDQLLGWGGKTIRVDECGTAWPVGRDVW